MSDNTTNPYDRFKIAEIKKCIDDPVYFIKNYVRIQHPMKGAIPFDMTDEQCEWIDAYEEHRFVIASVPRQKGKTSCGAAYLLWKAMFTPDMTIFVGGCNNAGAREVMLRLRFMYESLPDFLRCDTTSHNKQLIGFDNGSRIIARAVTGNAVRGLTISLIYLDEFAFVRPNEARDFWQAIMPCFSRGGECIISSTGNEGVFSEIWLDANNVQDNGLGKNGFKAIGEFTRNE